VRLFEKRRDQPNKGKLVTAEKRRNKKDIKLRDRDLKPPKNAKGGVGRAAKLANPLRSQADLMAPEEHAERTKTFGFSCGTRIPDGIALPYLFAAVGTVEASFWKRGSFRSGSNIGSSLSSAGVSGL
jgi:hypothetical protein